MPNTGSAASTRSPPVPNTFPQGPIPMIHRIAVVYREIKEHMFVTEVEANSPIEAAQKLRNMNGRELEAVSRTNWATDELTELRTQHISEHEKA